MIKEERYERIIAILNKNRFASVTKIQKETDIPISTLRRDLLELSANGRLIKLRGGASLTSCIEVQKTAEEPPFSARGQSNLEEKQRIALAAMAYIERGDTVIIDSGTTTYELAKQLKNFNDLMVATNDLSASVAMADNPNINLIVMGGRVRSSHYSIVGVFAENVLEQLHSDIVFLSVDAVDINHGLMAFNLEEVGVKRRMLKAAREVIVLCDHTKFSSVAFIKIADLTEVDCIITGSELEASVVSELRTMGIEVVLA